MFTSFLKKTSSYKITQEEELELVKQYQKTGDMKTLLKLKISLRPLIQNLASRAMSSGNDITLAQVAIRADGVLPELIKKYDVNSGVQLNTFLTKHLQGHFKNTVSENQLGAHVPRPEHDGVFQYQQALRGASAEYGKNPTPKQIMEFDDRLKTIDEVDRISQYNKKTLIADATYGNEDDGYVMFKDEFNTRGFDKDDHLRSLQLDQLKQLMNELDPQERKIIEEYTTTNKPMTAVAMTLGLSSSQVRKSINNWKKLIKDKGLDQL